MPSATVPTRSLRAVRDAISVPRASTYLTATHGDLASALQLYGWNARASSALMLPAHFAEVTTRNAASDVLVEIYGERWPWSESFEQSLPNPRDRSLYNPTRDLRNTRSRFASAGKVIAELKLSFWESLFTKRHDRRLWNKHIGSAFPQAPTMPAASLRARVRNDIESIRRLRNRIAHHEPIITRDLVDDLNRMLDLVELRSGETAIWLRAMEEATTVLAERP